MEPEELLYKKTTFHSPDRKMRGFKSKFYEFAKMAETGPVVPVGKFDVQLFKEATNLVKEYDIHYNPENVVPTDRGLIGNVFDAGMELPLRVGLLCTSIERVITFTKKDVEERMAMQPREMSMGEGMDAATMYQRQLEDNRPPFIVVVSIEVRVTRNFFDSIASKAKTTNTDSGSASPAFGNSGTGLTDAVAVGITPLGG